jgi:hypothetical protein
MTDRGNGRANLRVGLAFHRHAGRHFVFGAALSKQRTDLSIASGKR